jgi:putative spermidine/putrescine transport system permease protein
MAELRQNRNVPLAAIAWVCYLFLILPCVVIFPLSFSNRLGLTFFQSHFSLDLYRQYFSSDSWTEVTVRSGEVALAATGLALILGVPGAYGLARSHFFGKRLLTVFLLSPVLVPAVVLALGLYLYFSRLHLISTIAGLILAHTMYVTPFVIVTTLAGLQQVDDNLERAATVMGASAFRTFIQIVVPQIFTSILTAGLFAFLMSFDEVVIAWFITGPSTMTLPVKMYSSIKWETSPVLAAIATLLSLLSLLICLLGLIPARAADRQQS